MPKRRKKRGKAEPAIGAARVTGTGDTITFNTDSSMVVGAAPGDVHVNRMVWEGWLNEFDNHVVFGDGATAIHRFYNNAPGMTSEEMVQPGVIAPFGEPSVEIRGNVLLDTAPEANTALIAASEGTNVHFNNLILDSPNSTSTSSAVSNIHCGTTSGTTTGWGPTHTRWMALQDFIASGSDAIPTSRADIDRWLGWENFGCRHNTRHYSYLDDEGVPRSIHGESPEARRRRVERKNRRNTAELRAEQLLWNVLDRDQRRDWRRHGYFHLNVGLHRYRIEVRKRSGNVHLVDRAGERLKSYCCHTKDYLPNADNALAQMMTLLHDEEGFLALANVRYDRERRAGNITFDNGGVIYHPEQAAA